MNLAAAYYRMSSDAQEASIPAQREAVARWTAGNGWKIVAEYQDEGISGDATERRTGFQRMIADATSGRFAAVIVWDLARLGRFDSLEGGYWLFPLRQAGVTLITLDRGPIDWHDFGGRIVWSVEQEGKNAYLRTLSRDVLRGKLKAAAAGRRQGGSHPIGYRCGPDLRLVVDPERAAIVQRIFREYLAGASLRGLAERLNLESVPSPRGGRWHMATLRAILRNRVYLGEFHWNQESRGRYSRAAGGTIKGKRDKARGNNPEPDRIVFRGHHEPIVTVAEFDAAQRLLAKRRSQTTPIKGGGKFVLAGLCWCGHCGHRMAGKDRGEYLDLSCRGYLQHGRAVCQQRAVRQSEIVDRIVAELEKELQFPGVRDAVVQSARGRISRSGHSRSSGEIVAARKRLDKATAEVAKLEARLCEVESRFLPVVQRKLADAVVARDSAAADLQRIDRPAKELQRETAERLKRVRAVLGDLRKAVRSASPERLRTLLQGLVTRVDLWIDGEPQGKRTRWKLRKIAVSWVESR